MLDQMDDDRFRALQRQWRRSPPVHWLVARFVGYKPPSESSGVLSAPPPMPMEALRAAFGSGRLST